jgi:uncharacterized protein YggE
MHQTRMRLAAALLGSLALLGGAARSAAQDAGDAATATRTLRVGGEAQLEAAPDLATIRLGVDERSPDLQRARERVAATVERFLKQCDALGIDRDAVQTTAVSVSPQYRYDRESAEQTLTGYRVSRQLVVRLEQIDLVGALIESSVKLGVNQASPPQLGLSDRSRLERNALAMAAEDARDRALTLAETLGARLGPARQIDAVGDRGGQPPPVYAARMSMDESAETYSAGTVTVSARVTVVFDLLID